MTLALAIIGTVTGLIGSFVAIRRELHERAKLTIHANPLVDGSRGYIVVTVDNHGRRAVTIKRLCLYCDVADGTVPGGSTWELGLNEPWNRTRIEADGSMPPLQWEAGPELTVPADAPFRAFAEYGKRHRVWSPEPFAYFRALLIMGWAPDVAPAELLEERPGLAAKAVESRWKLWKSKPLRHDVIAKPLPREQITALRKT